jgi:ubiquinone/menaquinone biosynthesis C-methylase UbiE
VVSVSEVARDRWSEWLLRRRHGGDPERQKAMHERLTRIRDAVLDRARLDAGDTLLDVGCGDGLIGFGGLDRVGPTGRVIFSDLSQDLLDLCRQRAVELDAAERCAFVLSSADRLDAVAGESVDAVTARSVLIYVNDKPACFREFHRVLRRGGRLSVYEPINAFATRTGSDGRFCGYDIAPVAELAAKVKALYADLQPPDTDPMLDFDERDLLHAAEQAGFTEIHLELRVDIEPQLPPLAWDGFAHSAGNPLIPTLAEALAQTLNPAEAERFRAHLRPLVESGRGGHRLATASLGATKRSTAPGTDSVS